MANNSCSVVLTELGVAAFDEGGRLIASKKFGDATRSYRLLKSGSIPDEVRQFIEKLRPFNLVTANDASVVGSLRQAGFICSLMPEDQQKLVAAVPRDNEVIKVFKIIAGMDPLPPRR